MRIWRHIAKKKRTFSYDSHNVSNCFFFQILLAVKRGWQPILEVIIFISIIMSPNYGTGSTALSLHVYCTHSFVSLCRPAKFSTLDMLLFCRYRCVRFALWRRFGTWLSKLSYRYNTDRFLHSDKSSPWKIKHNM